MKTLKEILQRKAELRTMLADPKADLKAIETELRELNEMQSQLEIRERLNKEAAEINNGETLEKRENFIFNQEENNDKKISEKRGQALKENRSVSIGSSNIVLPQNTATDIKPTFNQVSTLIDRVNIKPLNGGESFKQPYEVDTAEGGYTAEGAAATDADTTFNYATVNKTKVTAYSEETEETLKLPNADYDSVIRSGISKSLRRKITKEILIGDGTTNHLVGIFDDGATAIDPATDISIAAIDENTLDEITFSYGGPEDVEDEAVLILNKLDLKAFSKVKGVDKKSAYTIKRNGNTGTINDVPFIINSACKAISLAGTTSGQYGMAYGNLSSYLLAIFSDVDVQRSTDYKFKEGMIAHKGSVFVGGNVCCKNGFLRVKKS